jgi:hypothetical protein
MTMASATRTFLCHYQRAVPSFDHVATVPAIVLACSPLQVQSRTMQQPHVISGPVVLAKSPVSHMGDVRRVEAVAPGGWAGQQLAADYVNLVVFSQKGQRPLPNMLAGSDLVRRKALYFNQMQIPSVL